MEKVITEKYISFDNMTFKTKEKCELYEKNYLTDVELEACFYFFHNKPEDEGNIETAYYPSDATAYKFKISRQENEQCIQLYEYFKSSGKLCKRYTRLGFLIKDNQDFTVLYDAINGRTDVHYQGKTTYNIKEFYNFLDNLKRN